MITFAAPTIAGSYILRAVFIVACIFAAGAVITMDAGF